MTIQEYYILAYCALILIGRMLTQKQRRADKVSTQAQQIIKDPTAILMVIGAIIAFVCPLIEASMRDNFEFKWLPLVLGVIIITAGWMVIFYANKTIADNWSPSIAKTEAQQLVMAGIYSIVRHPLYFAGLLILTGTNIYFQNRWSWLAALAAFVITLYRIPSEERQLEARFGQEYIVYKQNTKAIIPWIL
jgi:protein-S-isoprenylcysteine O-methyltransferase Ste14